MQVGADVYIISALIALSTERLLLIEMKNDEYDYQWVFAHISSSNFQVQR